MASVVPAKVPAYDRLTELKAFDQTKAGCKGLADAGIQKLPRIFMHPPDTFPKASVSMEIPTIDLGSTNKSSTVEKIRTASENIGLFQIVDHGIPMNVMEEMLEGVRRFHEQDAEVKAKYYSRDASKPLAYYSNFDLYTSPAAAWKDTFASIMAPNPPPYEELSEACRDIQIKYSNEVLKLGAYLFQLISEGLGLHPNYLGDLDCDKGFRLLGHYAPDCPNPELTVSSSTHTDAGFLTVLLQDDVGGLQILHQNQWVDVPPIPGALVVNIGDLLQLMTNDKLKSVGHRVLACKKGPRMSVACFFRSLASSEKYRPLDEFVSSDNPPRYKETTVSDYFRHTLDKGLDDTPRLQRLKLY